MKLSTKLLRIQNAINSKFLVKIKYHDITRDVQPHILGYNFDKNLVLRVFERLRDGKKTNQFKIYSILNS